MKHITKGSMSIIGMLFVFIGMLNAQWQTEELDRGVVAVKMANDGAFVGWRMLATDPDSIAFNVYRGSSKINDSPITTSTNFVDAQGTVDDSYHIVPVLGGAEKSPSKTVKPWSQNYLSIPLQRPAGGNTPDGVSYTYNANDCSAADLDGDGTYEIVLKWDPSNAKDNSQSGYTGNVFLDGLKLDGTLLWRIDLGRNIRAGAHYTQFMVYDLDGDGKAELACKTADGSVDGTGAVIGDADADYRNSSGYILSGPEFFTIFNGETGAAMATVPYLPPRGSVSSWGDNYGNRVDRFLACVAYLDGSRPSVVMCRGYYTRSVLVAWDWRDGQLTNRWIFDSNNGYPTYTGQGNHNLSVGDVDGDGKDEIVYGSMAIDDDGSGLWNSRLGHGDAMHLSDIDPNRPGLEVWGIHENATRGSALLDARTGEILWNTGPGDVGRGVSANLVDTYDGMECWGGTDGLRSCVNVRVGNSPSSTNHAIWWDGDLARELLDGTTISKYNGSALLSASGCSSNNGTKSNPCLQADLFGDWREEAIFRTSNNSALRIYTTTNLTQYRLVTLMHDRVYRLGVAWQNVAYNQPPHTSYFIGAGMSMPDSLRPPYPPKGLSAIAMADSVALKWSANTESDLAGYNLYRARQLDGPFGKINSELIARTSYTDATIINDSTYYYAVAAVDMDNNESAFSDTIEATPTFRPAQPTGLLIRHDLDAVKIDWQESPATDIAGYNVYRSLTAGGDYTLLNDTLVTETSYLDASLTSMKTYYYVITTVDVKSTESAPSEELQVTPGPTFSMQAEDGVIRGTVSLADNYAGYHGSGYVDFASAGSAMDFTDLPGFGGGDAILRYRYALGSADRTGTLVVNNRYQNLTMRNTGAWTNYVSDSLSITLKEGFSNSIRFQAMGSDFGNLDEITLVAGSQTLVEQPDGSASAVPSSYQLQQNFPNPFNPKTVIAFDLPDAASVLLQIYDVQGRLVAITTDKAYKAGRHQVSFEPTGLASGVYFIRSRMVSLGNRGEVHIFTKKMMFLK